MERVLAVAFASLCWMGAASAQQGSTDAEAICEQVFGITHNGPIPAEQRANIEMTQIARDRELTQPNVSANGIYAFEIVHFEPDAARDLPWRAELLIDNAADHLVRIYINVSRDIRVEWVSEKLIFLRPWWGRIVASDLIFDVEAEAFVYEEAVLYVHQGIECR